jgi:hypothetical protein
MTQHWSWVGSATPFEDSGPRPQRSSERKRKPIVLRGKQTNDADEIGAPAAKVAVRRDTEGLYLLPRRLHLSAAFCDLFLIV